MTFQLKKQVISGMRLFIKKIIITRNSFSSFSQKILHEDSSDLLKKNRAGSLCKSGIWAGRQRADILEVSGVVLQLLVVTLALNLQSSRGYAGFGNKPHILCFIKYRRKYHICQRSRNDGTFKSIFEEKN